MRLNSSFIPKEIAGYINTTDKDNLYIYDKSTVEFQKTVEQGAALTNNAVQKSLEYGNPFTKN